MSKVNNKNPGQYDGDRNHQGEGRQHEDAKRQLNENEKSQGREGQKNFIPGESAVGEPGKNSRNEDNE